MWRLNYPNVGKYTIHGESEYTRSRIFKISFRSVCKYTVYLQIYCIYTDLLHQPSNISGEDCPGVNTDEAENYITCMNDMLIRTRIQYIQCQQKLFLIEMISTKLIWITLKHTHPTHPGSVRDGSQIIHLPNDWDYHLHLWQPRGWS